MTRCTEVDLNLVKPWLGHGKARRHRNLRKKSANQSMSEGHDHPSSSRQNTLRMSIPVPSLAGW